MGWVISAMRRPLYSREEPGTHCIRGWVGPKADLDRYGKTRLHRDSISVLCNPQRFAISTALSRPTVISVIRIIIWILG